MHTAKPLVSDCQHLPDSINAPVTADRLFFALFPDPMAAVDIIHLAQTLRHRYALHGNPVPKERLHVTLVFFGDFAELPQSLLTAAKAAAERVEAEAFGVTFDRVSSFSGRSRKHPLILSGGDGLKSLRIFRERLGKCMQERGLERYLEAQYLPHITLLYDKRALKSQTTDPVRWTVREFAMVHRRLGHSDYRILGRWSLH